MITYISGIYAFLSIRGGRQGKISNRVTRINHFDRSSHLQNEFNTNLLDIEFWQQWQQVLSKAEIEMEIEKKFQ
jgi:hypothetical protein